MPLQANASGDSKTTRVGQVNSVYLSTAVVLVRDSKNKFRDCRILLDMGAQSNFITVNTCSRLGLSCKNTNIILTGLGQDENRVSAITNVAFKSKYKSVRNGKLMSSNTKNNRSFSNFTVEIKLEFPKISI